MPETTIASSLIAFDDLPLRDVAGTRRARKMLLAILTIAALVKLALLALVGPSFQLDSPAYIGFADDILSGRAFRPFDLNAAALPDLAFRMAGYPLVIAGAKLVTAEYWAAIVVLLQDAATLAVSALIFVVLRHVFWSLWVPSLVVILYLCSGSLLWDNSILSDSLYASLFNLVIFVLIGGLVCCWRLKSWSYASLGLLWGGSLLFRDSGLYFTYLPLLLIGAIAWNDGDRRTSRWLPVA